jgi:hypothetical protein
MPLTTLSPIISLILVLVQILTLSEAVAFSINTLSAFSCGLISMRFMLLAILIS